MAFAARHDLLEQMLRDGQVRRAKALSPGTPHPLPTGVPSLDAALGGGLCRGQLHELVGPPGAGATALLCAALASATGAGELCALIDPGNTFDPSQRGIDLLRLLWVRPRDPVQALRAAEIALEARFALVALDLGDVSVLPPPRAPRGLVQAGEGPRHPGGGGPRHPGGGGPRHPGVVVRFEKRLASAGTSPWARLARKAEKHGGALLLLARASQAGTFAAATIELMRGPAQWEGRQGAPGRYLRGAQSVGAVARHKRMPPSPPLPFTLPLEPR